MKGSTLIDLVQNTALLLFLALLYENFWLKKEVSKSTTTKIFAGFIIGIVGIVLMLTPWVIQQGVSFDARTIMLSISGLFFGPIPTIIAMIITSIMRLIMGGDGMWMGLIVIISSGTIGLLWKRYRPHWQHRNKYLELLTLGLIVHGMMFASTLVLPATIMGSIQSSIALPLLLIYSPGTMLLGLLLLQQSTNYQNNLARLQDINDRKLIEKELKNSLSLIQTTLESIHNGILVVDPAGKIIKYNSRFIQMWHIPKEVIALGEDKTLINYILDQLVDPNGFISTVSSMYDNEETESLDLIYFRDGRIFERLTKPINLEDEKKGRIWTFLDITERMQAIERLEESEKKFRDIYQNSHEGIFQTNYDGTYISVNPALARMYGFATPEELINSRKDISKEAYSDPTERDNFLKMMEKDGFVKGYEYEVKQKDGNRIWFYEDAHAVKDEQGNINFFEGFVIDITQRKLADAEIKQKTEELLKLNNEKDKFFSIIAHDLRSPFTSFLGLTQIMAEELPHLTTSELKKIVESMRNSAVNLFRLLENLLQWSRIEQGSLPFNPESTILLTDIEDSIAMVLESARGKGIEITYQIPDDIMIFADSNMLKTVIRNLVSNAIKFTPIGGKIILEAKYSGNSDVEISIRDTGIGMCPKIKDNLFKLNAKTNREGTQGEPSSGLGLLLCKEFITRHGGQIWIESEEGQGSTFYFTFPHNPQPVLNF
jgi:PAS domain S-box-containing protein